MTRKSDRFVSSDRNEVQFKNYHNSDSIGQDYSRLLTPVRLYFIQWAKSRNTLLDLSDIQDLRELLFREKSANPEKIMEFTFVVEVSAGFISVLVHHSLLEPFKTRVILHLKSVGVDQSNNPDRVTDFFFSKIESFVPLDRFDDIYGALQ